MAELFQNYGTWLLFGVMMFFMMRRGGCCGGHSHNDRDNHNNRDIEKTTTLNVEGMTCGHCKASVEKTGRR